MDTPLGTADARPATPAPRPSRPVGRSRRVAAALPLAGVALCALSLVTGPHDTASAQSQPATVGALLDRYPNLWVELALRTDVAPRGALDPAWEAVFRRHPDRFMIGTDTWIASRWPQLPRLMADVRAWLRQLPRDLAERIAWRNAEALFGPAR